MNKALDISRDYYYNIARESFRIEFPMLIDHIATGLVGNGSECFGFDDDISIDHDWGCDFFIWVDEEIKEYIPDIMIWKERLFSSFPPKNIPIRTKYGSFEKVSTVFEFYDSIIGIDKIPLDLTTWLKIPEENLALAVNGEVFEDNSGNFSAVREYLINYYPNDIILKRLSHYLMMMSQTGQYNLLRSAKRNDIISACITRNLFCDYLIKTIFTINHKYKPYYKWVGKSMEQLSELGKEMHQKTEFILSYPILNSDDIINSVFLSL